jgi:hypothetical protein
MKYRYDRDSYYRRNNWRGRWYRRRERMLILVIFVNGILIGGIIMQALANM